MMTYTRHAEHDFTLFVSKGDTTIDEWLDTIVQYSLKGISRLELYDLREHTNLFSNDEIEMILAHAVKNTDIRPKGNRTAILVSGEAQYGLSRMYEGIAMVEGLLNNDTMAFYNLAEAVDWLGGTAKDALDDYV
jgi:hypothetical protein